MGAISSSFTAQWNELNGHLKEANHFVTLSGILSPIQDHAKAQTLPAAWVFSEAALANQLSDLQTYWSASPLHAVYRMEKVSVEAPDGAVLSAYCFLHKDAKPGTRTALLLNGNCVTAPQMPFRWLLEEAATRSTPCNFVAFDYRTVASSTGSLRRASDLTIDADAMMQFIEEKMETPRENIAIYGWSLGGSVGANAALLQPDSKAPVILERTFSTSSKVVIPGQSAIHQAGQFFLSGTLNSVDWEMDTASPTKRLLNQGRPVLVIHHPLDPIMQKAASLFEAVKDHPSLHSLALGEEGEDAPQPWVNHHLMPLTWYEVEEGRTAASVAADFLLR